MSAAPPLAVPYPDPYPTPPPSGEPAPGGPPGPRPRRHRRGSRRALGLVLTLAVVGGAAGAAYQVGRRHRPPAGITDNAAATSTALVADGPLASQTQVDATLGYAGTAPVVNQAPGVITGLPSVGQIVQPGQVLYRVSGQPVVLLTGATPTYRSLALGASGTATTGPDVAELNASLVALGYASRAQLNPASDVFSPATQSALDKLQGALGQTVTGTLPLGSAVFLTGAARVTSLVAVLGGPAQPGATVLQTTSTTRQVSVQLDAAQQAQVAVGDAVLITLPSGRTTPGIVARVGTVATAASGGNSPGGNSGPPTVEVDITPTDPAATGSLDQAPVEVAITTASVPDALSVPVNALLALAGGGYAVEAIGAHGAHALVPVTLGIFDDETGTVQVTGALAAGQRIVVPSS